MNKQIGNLEVPILFETRDNPHWTGVEADKYRNVVKETPVTFADEIMSNDDYIIWNNCSKWSIDEIYIKMKYGMWAEEMELQFIPDEFVGNVEKARIKYEEDN